MARTADSLPADARLCIVATGSRKRALAAADASMGMQAAEPADMRA